MVQFAGIRSKPENSAFGRSNVGDRIRNAGYIASIQGRNGGYVLIKEPSSIPLRDLLRMIDGPIAPLPCLSRRAYQRCEDCTDETACRIRKLFAEVFWSYLLLIESLTLADLAGSPAAAEQILTAPTGVA